MSKPKVLWAFWANNHGAWYKLPQKVTYDDVTKMWWHKNQNDGVTKKGFTDKGYAISFASEDKQEVQTFIDGFMACRSLLSGFFKD